MIIGVLTMIPANMNIDKKITAIPQANQIISSCKIHI